MSLQILSTSTLSPPNSPHFPYTTLFRSLASTPRAVLARQSLDPVPRIHTVRQTVPSSGEQAITKALAKVPADRFATAARSEEHTSELQSLTNIVCSLLLEKKNQYINDKN